MGDLPLNDSPVILRGTEWSRRIHALLTSLDAATPRSMTMAGAVSQ